MALQNGERFTQDQLPSICSRTHPDAYRTLTDHGNLNEKAYATIALLNDLRRKRQFPELLKETEKSAKGGFMLDIALNFEGTEEDNYCFGTRMLGCKWYVGISENEERRHRVIGPDRQ